MRLMLLRLLVPWWLIPIALLIYPLHWLMFGLEDANELLLESVNISWNGG